jgi:hypothetical protein
MNPSLLKSMANKTRKPNSMATMGCVMPGFSPAFSRLHPCALLRSKPTAIQPEGNHHRIKKTTFQAPATRRWSAFASDPTPTDAKALELGFQ